MKVTLSAIVVTVIVVGAALGVIGWYMTTQQETRMVSGGQKGINVEKCFGTTVLLKNVGTMLVNDTTFEVYYKPSDEKTGARFSVTLGAGDYGTFNIVASDTGEPFDLRQSLVDDFYAYAPNFPLAFFPC